MYRICKIYNGDNRDEKGLWLDLDMAQVAANKLLQADPSILFIRIFDDFEGKQWDITRN